MEAATLLFGEKGYTATTIREVAEKAGVSELTIFRNFKIRKIFLGEYYFTDDTSCFARGNRRAIYW